VNFFRVLRDQKEPLIEAIGLTPFPREELALASLRQTEGITELERARRFFLCARQLRTGLAQTSSAGRWAHCLFNQSRWHVRSRVSVVSTIYHSSLKDYCAFKSRMHPRSMSSDGMIVLKRYSIATHPIRAVRAMTPKHTPMK
jgi:site-specific DNA-adenine methylase